MSTGGKIRVKICGITRESDARAVAELGGWAVGFIFFRGSPRFVTPRQAEKISSSLPAGIERFGVFVNASAADVKTAREAAGITVAQLHGEESPELVAEVMELGLPIVKGIRKGDLLGRYPSLFAYLVDGGTDPDVRGGSGEKADWNLARAAKAFAPVILAGGLNAGNIAAALTEVEPYAVDLSSSMESAPGIKDPMKLKVFFEKVHELERLKP